MKKSIDSRKNAKKSRKAKLAAGVLAIILAMFPSSSAKAQPSPFDPSGPTPVATPANPNDGWWQMVNMSDIYYDVTESNFTQDWIFGYAGYGSRDSVGDYVDTVHAHHTTPYRVGMGHFVSDDERPNAFRIFLEGGSITVTPWVGRAWAVGQPNTDLAMLHYGGDTSLSFINYNQNAGVIDDQSVDGAVLYIATGINSITASDGSSIDGVERWPRLIYENGNWVLAPNTQPGITISHKHDGDVYFDNNYGRNGGAIYVANGTLNLSGVTFGNAHGGGLTANGITSRYGNHATGVGGAIANTSTLNFTNTGFINNTATRGGALHNGANGTANGHTGSGFGNSFTSNEARERGGAIFNAGTGSYEAAWRLNKSILGGAIYNEGHLTAGGSWAANSATGNAASRGGAIYNDTNGVATFSGLFLGNTAVDGLGGAIYNMNAVTLNTVTFGRIPGGENLPMDQTNKALDGAGFYNDGTTATLTANVVSFTQNEATRNGGGIYNNRGLLILNDTDFSGNDAVGLGGGIYTIGGSATIRSSDFSTNTAEAGAAIYNISQTMGRIDMEAVTFENNEARTGDGGAIYNNGIIAITGNTVPSSFAENKAVSAGARGGAVYNALAARFSITNAPASFTENRANLAGGAIFNDVGGVLKLSGISGDGNITFSENRAGITSNTDGAVVINMAADGGAIYSSLNGTLDLNYHSFTLNKAADMGGAIFVAGKNTTNSLINLKVENTTFTENEATSGGAIYNGENGLIEITNVNFERNKATAHGGALYNSPNLVLNLTDVSFVGNTTTAGDSGAIYNESSVINFNVVNRASVVGSNGSAGQDEIYFAGADDPSTTGKFEGSTFNVNVESQEHSLIMHGAMRSEAGSDVVITKDGAGFWDHYAESKFDGKTTDFTVEDGTLLLRAKSSLNLDGNGDNTASIITFVEPTNPVTPVEGSLIDFTGTPSLVLEADATGRSILTTDRIVTQTGASIVVGTVVIPSERNPMPSFTDTVGGNFVFGMADTNATDYEGWIQSDIFQIDGTTTIIAGNFTFQTPDPSNPSPVDKATSGGLHFEGATEGARSGDGPILVLRPTSDIGARADVKMESDIFLKKPTSFGNGSYIILAEVKNGGTFNGGVNDSNVKATTGEFWLMVNGIYTQGTVGQFQRSATKTPYEGLTVTSNADQTGEWIVYASLDTDTKSSDLRWTGDVDGTAVSDWDSINVDGAAASKNWFGTVASIPVTQFLDGDTVYFSNNAAGKLVTNKVVDLANDLTVNNMTVDGSGYTFNMKNNDLTGKSITFGSSTINVERSTGAPGSVASTITADSITLGNRINFATVSAVASDVYLGLEMTGTGVINVTSDINVDTLTVSLGVGGEIILIKAGVDDTLTFTGDRLVNGNAIAALERTDTPGTYFYGIDLNADSTAIVLKNVDAASNTDELYWAGVSTVGGEAGPSDWISGASRHNWRGNLAGAPVTTFKNGDSVFFADKMGGKEDDTTVTNKRVNVAGVVVGDMTVTGSGYEFDLTGGSITAQANVDTGAVGNIDFGTAKIIADKGTTVTAAGGIHFAGGNNFEFDLTSMADTDTALSLVAAGDVTGRIGSGVVNITNRPGTLGPDDVLVLIDAGAGNGIIEGNNRLLVNGVAVPFVRTVDPADHQDVSGLDVIDNDTKLVLTTVNTGDNGILTWAGTNTNGLWDVNTTANWAGSVGGHIVDKFLTNDSVLFEDTYTDATGQPVTIAANRKTVNVATGGVTVGDMTVNGDGFTFNLVNGGIEAKANAKTGAWGDIDFGTAKIVAGIGSTVTAERWIDFDGANEFEFDLADAVDGDTFLTLDAQYGVYTNVALGSGNIYVTNENLQLNESVVLIDTGTNYAVTNTGTLYVDGEQVVVNFERGNGEEFLGLLTDNMQSQLILKKINGDANSTDLMWTGTKNGVWDGSRGNTETNWSGSVAGFHVDTFFDGDSVIFNDFYVDADGYAQTVDPADKAVTIAQGGVVVGDMTVNGTGYTFDLTNGGITAQANAQTGANGNIRFGMGTTLVGLGANAGSSIQADGDIIFTGGTALNITIGETNDPLISAGGSVDLTGTRLDFKAYNGHPDDDPITIIEADSDGDGTGTLTGWAGDEVIGRSDFIYSNAYKEGEAVKVNTELSWYDAPVSAHGDFTLGTDEDFENFELGTDLKDRSGEGPFTSGWDGNSLTKKGNGTLTLTGDESNYSGGTTIEDGKLVAGHVNAVGTGDVAIQGNGKFEVAADGTFDNVIRGAAGNEVIFGSTAGGKLTIDADNDYTGKTTISTGTVRLETATSAGDNDPATEIVINAGAVLELGFGVDNIDPCMSFEETAAAGAHYDKKITGAGGLSIDGGTVVLTNLGNNFSGGTSVKGTGTTLIVDNISQLGNSQIIDIATGSNFTLRFGGEFDREISGDGKLYLNPGAGNSVTLTGDSSDFTGITEICTGLVTIENINGVGAADVTSDVIMRNGTKLVFDTDEDGEFNRRITGQDADSVITVEKNGDATVMLNGDNNYKGSTIINGGQLIAGHVNAVGSSDVTVNGTAIFEVAADGTFDNNIAGSADGTVIFGSKDGTLVITGTNTYAGSTSIANGSVRANALSALGLNDQSTDIAIADDATLTIALGAQSGTLNKSLGGGGTFASDLTGNLLLAGDNNEFYGTLHLINGTTTFADANALLRKDAEYELSAKSTLAFATAVGETDIEGDITLDGSGDGMVDISTGAGTSITLSGYISGSGGIKKVGDGQLILDNAENDFDGLTIDAGKLTAMNADSLGAGDVTNKAILELIVNSNEQLAANIDSKAGTFIKSGNGNLDIGRNSFKAKRFEMNGGSVEVQLSANDAYAIQADQFVETESSTVIGSYQNTQGDDTTDGLSRGEERAMEFLALKGAGSDGFSEYVFQSDRARVKWKEVFRNNEMYFALWLSSFTDAYADQLSYNANQAAGGVDRLPDGNALLDAVEAYEKQGGDMVAALSSLHGEIYKSSIYATVDLQRSFNESISNRRLYCEHCRDFKQFRGQAANDSPRELWATFTGGGNYRTGFDRFSGYSIGRWGVQGGLENRFGQGFFTGVAMAYEQADMDLKDLPQKDNFYAFRVAGYGNYTVGDVSMVGYLGYTKNWHDVERDVAFLGAKAKSSYDDDVVTLGFDVAKTYHWGQYNIIPTIGANYVHVRTPLITETGAGAANLIIHADKYRSFQVPIGVRTNSRFNIQNVIFQPEFRLFYVAELAEEKVRGHASYATYARDSFIVDSGSRGFGSVRIGLGVQAELFDYLSVGVDYDGEIWSDYSRHDVGANFKLRW